MSEKPTLTEAEDLQREDDRLPRGAGWAIALVASVGFWAVIAAVAVVVS